MKILFFSSFPPPNTGQTLSNYFYFKKLKENFDIKKINTGNKSILNRGSGTFSIKVLINTLINIFKLIYTLLLFKPKIIYLVYSSSKIGIIRDYVYLIVVRSFAPKIKIVAHIHSGNYGDEGNRYCLMKILRMTDKFIFLSKKLIKISNLLKKEKIEIVPNSISEKVFFTDNEIENKIKKRSIRKELNLVFLGNMIKEKGYLDVVKSLKYLNLENKINLYLIGTWRNKNDRIYVENYFEDDLKKNFQIKIKGTINNQMTIKHYLSIADIVLLPSYYKIEAFPISIIEALNSATPVIGTNHAAIPEIILNGSNGFIVDEQSPKQIADCIIKLNEFNVWKEFASNARNSFLQNYCQEKVFNFFKKIFIQ
ncbi:MAG: hypothetical protein CMP69_00925 [Flavobacteriales bacterium]|nr:hypothetical protein [Flavobacteriales bacterium]